MSKEITEKIMNMYNEADPDILGQQSVTCYVEGPISLGHLDDLNDALAKIPGFKFTIQCQVIAT